MFCLSQQASLLAASPHARPSREIFTTGCGYPKPAGWFSSSRVAAPPSPPARLWLNARRIAADSSPLDRRWLKPAGSPLTHARRLPLTLARGSSPHHGQACRAMSPESWFLSLVLPSGTVLMYLVGLVHGDSSGAGGSCSGLGGHFQPPAPLSWKRLLRDPVRAPDSLSCPEEASASELAQEGFLLLGECLVLCV